MTDDSDYSEATLIWDFGSHDDPQDYLLATTRASDCYQQLVRIVTQDQITWRGDGVVTVRTGKTEMYRILLQTGLYSPQKILLRNF